MERENTSAFLTPFMERVWERLFFDFSHSLIYGEGLGEAVF